MSNGKGARARRLRKLDKQRKAANIRGKYGPKRKPALVTVKSLKTGETIETVDQSRLGAYARPRQRPL